MTRDQLGITEGIPGLQLFEMKNVGSYSGVLNFVAVAFVTVVMVSLLCAASLLKEIGL